MSSATAVRKVPANRRASSFPVFGLELAVDRDETRGNRRGEHRVKKHAGDSAGGEEGVGFHAHAVVDGQQAVAVETQDFPQQRHGHHDADGLSDLAIGLFQQACTSSPFRTCPRRGRSILYCTPRVPIFQLSEPAEFHFSPTNSLSKRGPSRSSPRKEHTPVSQLAFPPATKKVDFGDSLPFGERIRLL